ncbi:MAG: hypothetical protein U0Q55_17725 [Vicinamibacterales bacterium]
MKADDRLVFWGVTLVFLSLLTGLLLVAAPPFVANPRGVLAGHLEAAMNGMLLVIVGLFIERVRFSPRQGTLCRSLLLYSAYANWLFTTLAGVLGTREATPLAGAGYGAGPLAERLILIALVTVALSALAGVGLLVHGLRPGLRQA